MKKTIHYLSTILIAVIALIGVSYVQADWSNPGCGPTGCNTPAPINVGSSEQTKIGTLKVGVVGDAFGSILNSSGVTLRGLLVNGGAQFNSTIIIPANKGSNKVLTSDSNGNATWQASQSSSAAVLPGTICGFYDKDIGYGGTTHMAMCDGHNPLSSCPAGYTRTEFTQVQYHDIAVCVKDPQAYCSATYVKSGSNYLVNWTATIAPNTSLSKASFTWSGSDGLTGNQMVVSKIYYTAGTKNASVVVIDDPSKDIRNALTETCSINLP